MSAASAVLAGRVAAEAQMQDACRVDEPTEPVWDEGTGVFVPGVPRVIYDGRCQVQIPDAFESNPVAGEKEYTVQAATLKLPVDGSQGVKVGHTATITACRLDAALVNAEFKVAALHAKTYATSRRLRCEEITD